MLDSSRFRKLTLIITLLAIPFFFIGGPSSLSLNIYHRFWDFGHSFFFALVAVNLVCWKVIKKPKDMVVTFFIVLVLSVIIEKLQTFVGRHASWLDVLANMAGLLLGYSLTQVLSPLQIIIRAVALIGLIPGVWAFSKSAALCFMLWQQFPVLLNGEASLDAEAWGSDIHLQKRPENTGYKLLFSGKAFLSADMMGFIQSWKGYQQLVLEAENPSNETVTLVLRISDKQHELSGQDFNDRFNQPIALSPGWNRIEINLQEIEQAPIKRAMDLNNIYLLKLFLPKDTRATEIYLNKLYLQ